MNEWINISEQEPEDGQRILIAVDKYAAIVTVADFYYDPEGQPYFHQPFFPWHMYDLDEVYWWAPIPDRLDR